MISPSYPRTRLCARPTLPRPNRNRNPPAIHMPITMWCSLKRTLMRWFSAVRNRGLSNSLRYGCARVMIFCCLLGGQCLLSLPSQVSLFSFSTMQVGCVCIRVNVNAAVVWTLQGPGSGMEDGSQQVERHRAVWCGGLHSGVATGTTVQRARVSDYQSLWSESARCVQERYGPH
jgi:hypothetical protein